VEGEILGEVVEEADARTDGIARNTARQIGEGFLAYQIAIELLRGDRAQPKIASIGVETEFGDLVDQILIVFALPIERDVCAARDNGSHEVVEPLGIARIEAGRDADAALLLALAVDDEGQAIDIDDVVLRAVVDV